MSTGFHLLDHPNRNAPNGRFMGRFPRRATPSGVIVCHTTENLDIVGPDSAAENVANYFTHNAPPNYGSYHMVCDSDSIVPLLPYDHEAYQAGRSGSNTHAIGLSMAYKGHVWGSHPDRENHIIARMGLMCLHAMDWLETNYGIEVPLRVISASDHDRRIPGFVSHGALQSDRSDPWNNRDHFYDEKLFPVIRFFQNLPKAQAPVGFIDRVTPTLAGFHVAGWAADPDNLEATVRVRIYVDSTTTPSVAADDLRSDVQKVFPEYGFHRGFGVDVTVPFGTHTIKAYALDTNGADHALLAERVVVR